MPSKLAMLARGGLLRCPRCGSGGLFGPRFTLLGACPGCGLRLEREEGAGLGSMALNIGFTSLGFICFFAAGVAVTWPSVPWVMLTLGGVAFCAIFPVVFYPFSKTLWTAIDLVLHGSRAASSAAGTRVRVARDAEAVVISASGASRPLVVPSGTELVLARGRFEDVERVTCVPADPSAVGTTPGEFLIVRAADLAV